MQPLFEGIKNFKTLFSLGLVEFPSTAKEVASEAYNRADYQELSKLRWANSSDTNITIMDDSVTH